MVDVSLARGLASTPAESMAPLAARWPAHLTSRMLYVYCMWSMQGVVAACWQELAPQLEAQGAGWPDFLWAVQVRCLALIWLPATRPRCIAPATRWSQVLARRCLLAYALHHDKPSLPSLLLARCCTRAASSSPACACTSLSPESTWPTTPPPPMQRCACSTAPTPARAPPLRQRWRRRRPVWGRACSSWWQGRQGWLRARR